MARRIVRQLTNLRTPLAFVEDGFEDDDGSNGVIFRPGAPSNGNFLETWAEVRAVIADSNGALTIYVDSSLAPAVVDPGVTDFEGRTFLRAAKTQLVPAPMRLDVPDGAVLQDLAGILFTLNVVLHGTTGPTMKFTSAVSFGVFGGAVLDNQGTVPAIEVDPTLPLLILSAIIGAQILATGAPIVNVPNPGQQLILTEFTAGSFGGSSFATGPVGAGVQVVFDASAQGLPNLPGWAGTIALSQIDKADRMQYLPSNFANWSGVLPTSIADALDRIAAKITPIP